MSDNKKYYYLKLKESFFDGEEMKVLESMPNGIAYQNFYLKLCLLALKSGGALLFKNTIPYDMQMLSTVLRMNIDTVKTGIEVLIKFKLIEVQDNGTIYMADIQSLIGLSSTEAERVKLYRSRIKQKELLYENSTNVVQTYKKRTPEIEIEIKKDIEIKKERKKKEFTPPSLEEIEVYVHEKKLVVNPCKFYDWYSKADWKDRDGKPVSNWKNKILNWDSREKEKNPNALPFSKPIQQEKKKPCPRCGGEVIGGICIICRTPVDENGKELS